MPVVHHRFDLPQRSHRGYGGVGDYVCPCCARPGWIGVQHAYIFMLTHAPRPFWLKRAKGLGCVCGTWPPLLHPTFSPHPPTVLARRNRQWRVQGTPRRHRSQCRRGSWVRIG